MASENQEFAPPSQAERTIHIQAALSKGHHSQIRYPSEPPIVPNSGGQTSLAIAFLKAITTKKSTQTAAQVDQQNRVCGPSVDS